MLPGTKVGAYLALLSLLKGIQKEVSILLQEGCQGQKLELQRRSDFPSIQRLPGSFEDCAGLL